MEPSQMVSAIVAAITLQKGKEVFGENRAEVSVTALTLKGEGEGVTATAITTWNTSHVTNPVITTSDASAALTTGTTVGLATSNALVTATTSTSMILMLSSILIRADSSIAGFINFGDGGAGNGPSPLGDYDANHCKHFCASKYILLAFPLILIDREMGSLQ
ncbi:unnamed protein product [Taenia asiatica]|uniref:Uncharacterized protein n=1 Tax=Taenia asiatica TaxID=60517 RepID=A0A0R3WEN0_TAEAS|nr:unnamed protein product [Taenia asiatica]